MTGKVSITVHRSIVQVAPDSVGFEVNLAGAGFETRAPASAEAYDPQYHDLYYYWDTGDTDVWTAPENIMPERKTKQTAYGPFIRHMYARPGTYAVGVTVVEPATGHMATGSVQIVVQDPEVVYAGRGSIYVSTDPAESWDGVPSTAQRYTNLGSAQAALDSLTIPCRLLFKRGQAFVHEWTADNISTDVTFSHWGQGEKPIITMTDGRPKTPFRFRAQYPQISAGRHVEVRFDQLAFVGEWNPINGSGERGAAMLAYGNISFMFSSVDFKGYGNIFVQDDTSKDNPEQYTGFHIHFDNMNLTNYQSYAVLTGRQTHSNISFTGCKLAQNVLAPSALAGFQGGGSVRIGSTNKLYLAACDFFHNMGHAGGAYGTNPFTWASNRLTDYPFRDGFKMNIWGCTFEGGAELINFGTVHGQNTKIANGLIHYCVGVGDHTTNVGILIRYAGFTIRNNLIIMPDVPQRLGPTRAFVGFMPRTGREHDPTLDPRRNAPNKAYNNTFVGLRSFESNENWAYLAVRDFQMTQGSRSENNVLYLPRIDGGNADAPLDTRTRLPWSARNQGWRNGDTGYLDRSYAPEDHELMLYRPLEGSAALGDAINGTVAYDDFWGRKRDMAYPSRGAFEAT